MPQSNPGDYRMRLYAFDAKIVGVLCNFSIYDAVEFKIYVCGI